MEKRSFVCSFEGIYLWKNERRDTWKYKLPGVFLMELLFGYKICRQFVRRWRKIPHVSIENKKFTKSETL
ncbi:Uncharacterised protein [uncultured Clostridium sp.]|nr:Uncharacterised protein [uncultured Clostridium sp.]